MKIHLISDLHVERDSPINRDFPKINADVCVLAGDMGAIRKEREFARILSLFKKNFPEVLMVLGNHEFYDLDYDEALKRAKIIADDVGVHLLDIYHGTESLMIDGKKFWGSTLWTDFNKNNPLVKMSARDGLNDFELIKNFTTDRCYEIHQETVKKIDWTSDVIISHHMPILRQSLKFPFSNITHGFCCSDLEDKIYESDVKFWLYGHTHENVNFYIGGTKIISNQTGYKFETPVKKYDPYLILEI